MSSSLRERTRCRFQLTIPQKRPPPDSCDFLPKFFPLHPVGFSLRLVWLLEISFLLFPFLDCFISLPTPFGPRGRFWCLDRPHNSFLSSSLRATFYVPGSSPFSGSPRLNGPPRPRRLLTSYFPPLSGDAGEEMAIPPSSAFLYT